MAGAGARACDLEAVRLELAARIAAIDGRARHPRTGDLALAVDEIRRIAHHAGLAPTVTVTHFIGAALARGEPGVLVQGWLPMLRDAIAADRQDMAACDTFAAACSIRLAA